MRKGPLCGIGAIRKPTSFISARFPKVASCGNVDQKSAGPVTEDANRKTLSCASMFGPPDLQSQCAGNTDQKSASPNVAGRMHQSEAPKLRMGLCARDGRGELFWRGD